MAPTDARFAGSLAALVLLAVLSAPALAQQPAPPPTPPPAPEPPPQPQVPPSPEPRVEVGGYVDVYYGYNFNRSDPQLRTFDVQHNTFSLSAADVGFSRTPRPKSRLGFNTDLLFGKSADLAAAFEPASEGKEIYKHVKQAYLSLLTGKVVWDAGKFVTPMGAEVFESQNNWNYTRSILFGYAVPIYHVGVRATYTPDPRVVVSANLSNGWNNASETNGDKTFCASLTLKPTAALSWVGNYIVGREAPEQAPVRDVRQLADTTLTWTPTPKLSLMANADFGSEGPVKWWGVAAYAKYQPSPAWAVVGRYEYLDDTQGGFMTIHGIGQSFTLTSDHLIAGGLRARLEYRVDHVDRDYFRKSDGSLVPNQTTVTVGLVYGFSGKI